MKKMLLKKVCQIINDYSNNVLKHKKALLSRSLSLVVLLLLVSLKGFSQTAFPFGFENNSVGNWVGFSSTETVSLNTLPANTRTGIYSLGMSTTSSSSNKAWTSPTPYITSASGLYIHFIYWGKAQDPSTSADASYKYSATTPPVVSTASQGNASNAFALSTTSWTRVCYGVTYNNPNAQRNYFPGPKKTTSGPTTIYLDDGIVYTSSSAITDTVKPATPTLVTGTQTGSNVNLSWTSATDAGTGVQATLILRTSVATAVAPNLNDQAIYSTTGGAAGPNIIGDWTVISDATGATATAYTDPSLANGTYKYAVVLRDLAYNYSVAGVSPTIIVGAAPPAPVLAVTTTGFNGTFGNIVTGANSVPQQFSVSGANLTAGIIVAAPAGFQVSTSATTGYATSITVAPVAGTVVSTVVYARFSPTAATGATGTLNINVSTTGATAVDMPVNGNALAIEPTTVGTITFGTPGTTSIIVNLPTVGNGSKRIIVIKQGAAPTFTPTDAASVTGVNASFTTATDQGSGNKIVYDGTGSAASVVIVTGLTAGSLYYFTVYEYNEGTGTSQNYLLTPVATGSNSTAGLPAPSIVILQTGFNGAFGNTVTGTNSANQQYTVSGTNLTADITITAPAGFQISTTATTGFGTTLTLPQSGGIVAATTVYARYAPTGATGATGSLNIVHASTGATSQNVTVSGNATATEPTTAGTISFGTIGTTSIVVNLPTTGNGAKRIIVAHAASAVTFIPGDGSTLAGVTAAFNTATDQGTGHKVIYDGAGSGNGVVTVTGLATGTTYYFTVYEYNEGTGTSRNYLATPVATNSTATLTPTPVITVIPGTFTGNFGNVVVATNSATQQYSINGTDLTAGITITAPAGFQVSTNATSGFGTTVILTPTGGGVATTIIYARYAPTTATGATGSLNINHTSTGAVAQTIAVNGNALSAEPTTTGTISFGTISTTSIVVNLPTVGNGTRRIIVIRQGAAPAFVPTDAVAVTGVSSDFSVATDQGSGSKVIYDGTGSGNSLVTVTNLAFGTQYYFAVYEYNMGTGTSQNYRITTSATGNATTLIPVPTLVVNTAGFTGTFGNVAMNSVSAAQSYTVSGSALTANITITAPAGFEVSTNATSGFAGVITIVQTGGAIPTTNIYVRYAPTTATGATGSLNIINASLPATALNVSVNGNALAVEPTGVGTITFGAVTDTTIVINQPTVGNGARRLIVANLGSPASFIPADALGISGVSSIFPQAMDQGNGDRIIYDGTGSGSNVVKVTGLTSGMLYFFTVYEYNVGTGASYNYLTNPAVYNNMTTSVPNLGVRTSGLAKDVRIYPNPAKSTVFVEATGIIRIYVTDATGRTIYRIENERKVDISPLPDGIYMMIITSDKGQVLRTEKIIKANN